MTVVTPDPAPVDSPLAGDAVYDCAVNRVPAGYGEVVLAGRRTDPAVSCAYTEPR
jgi:hypothetical protein